MIIRILLIVLGVYVAFLALSPIFVAITSLASGGPKEREAALRNGAQLSETTGTVVAVGAHPDDIEWYAGGTLAKLAPRGTRVIVVMVTDGGRLRKTRRQEQLAAARVVGYEKVVFLDYPDGSLAERDKHEVARRIEEVCQTYRPDTLITFDPVDQGPLYHHPDHVAAGAAAVEAADEAGVAHVYLFHSSKVDTWVDVTDTIDLKARARAAHRTQTRWFLTPFGMSYVIKEAAFVDGRKVGLTYAESFRKLR